jgi:hypothetical protein
MVRALSPIKSHPYAKQGGQPILCATASLADNRQSIEIKSNTMRFFKFSLANFPCRANFDSGMNLSLAAKRMTTSTSSIISTTTKSITANGEARN